MAHTTIIIAGTPASIPYDTQFTAEMDTTKFIALHSFL